MGFREDIEIILEMKPPDKRFSATMNPVEKLIKTLATRPVRFRLSMSMTVDSIEQTYYEVQPLKVEINSAACWI